MTDSKAFGQSITSLAILKVNWDRGDDYIGNFVPFVAECLRVSPQATVSLPELQNSAKEAFGLNLPQGALKTILKRVVKEGYAESIQGAYQRKAEVLAALDFPKLRADVLRQHEALIGKLVRFCKEQYEVRWSEEDAERALFSYLRDRSTPILAAVIEGRPITDTVERSVQMEFLVGAFIAHLCKRDPEGFGFLETVVKGSMLAGALYYPTLGNVQQRFGRTEVYFDTSFLLHAIGLGNQVMQTLCQEPLDILYGLNGRLRCFEHTVNEIQSILDFTARALRDRTYLKQAYSQHIWELIRLGFLASDVEFIAARLDRQLRRLRVKAKPKPPFTDRLSIDESKLKSILQSEVGYQNDQALGYDLDSLTAVYRLRNGEFPQRIESCNAIFVTTNPRLVTASAHFFEEEYGKDAIVVPHCILAHTLTTLVWLKRPLNAPDLPRKRLIADCYAALNPTDALWRAYLKEVNHLQEQGSISEEDCNLLRFSTEAKVLLMEATLGEPDTIVEGTIPEILERTREKIQAQSKADYQKEKEKRLAAELKAATAEAQTEALQYAQLNRCRVIGVHVGRWAARAIIGIGIALQLALAYLTIPQPFPGIPQEWLRLLLPTAFVISTILSIANMTFGTAIISYVKTWETQIAHWAERLLIRLFVPRLPSE